MPDFSFLYDQARSTTRQMGPRLHQQLTKQHLGPSSLAPELTTAIERVGKQRGICRSEVQTSMVSSLHAQWHFVTLTFGKAILQHFYCQSIRYNHLLKKKKPQEDHLLSSLFIDSK